MKSIGPIFEDHDLRVREKALSAFRFRNAKRKALIAIPAFVLLCGLVFFRGAFRTEKPSVTELAPPVVESGLPQKTGIINDEQLVALFPQGSCFIAEVNGKKILVFRDPDVKRQFFN